MAGTDLNQKHAERASSPRGVPDLVLQTVKETMTEEGVGPLSSQPPEAEGRGGATAKESDVTPLGSSWRGSVAGCGALNCMSAEQNAETKLTSDFFNLGFALISLLFVLSKKFAHFYC